MGPGKYLPDESEGITRLANLPPALAEPRSRVYRRRRCPRCGRGCGLHSRGSRRLHDVGDLRNGRPRDLHVVYSKHRCVACRRGFVADMTDLAPPKSSYTLRVVSLAVRLVVEDGLPYRIASWHLWRDHRVFVPFATLQNWIEAAGEKIGRPRHDRLP